MSAKTLDKFKICPKNGKLGILQQGFVFFFFFFFLFFFVSFSDVFKRIEDCPFVRKYLNATELPSFVGGACACTEQGGCIPGLPNGANKVF